MSDPERDLIELCEIVRENAYGLMQKIGACSECSREHGFCDYHRGMQAMSDATQYSIDVWLDFKLKMHPTERHQMIDEAVAINDR